MPVQKLIDIIDTLRVECPWDQKQTLDSLKNLTIEEVYELIDAINNKDYDEICAELGDVLTHLIFYAKIGKENKAFDFQDVVDNQCEKLIYRHPHVYGSTDKEGLLKVTTEEDVKKNWEQLKLKEGRKSVLSGVPKGLPSMIKASRIQEKAAGVGFDWHHIKDVFAKTKEEILELETAIVSDDKKHIEEELGDVLFSIINLARFLNINPEDALQKTNQKFITRFQYIEENTQKPLNESSLEEMEVLWQEAKQNEKQKNV